MVAIDAETYQEWFTKVSKQWALTPAGQYERYGQFLYNRMPDRFMGQVPHAIDPFYRDDNVVNFLNWLERRW